MSILGNSFPSQFNYALFHSYCQFFLVLPLMSYLFFDPFFFLLYLHYNNSLSSYTYCFLLFSISFFLLSAYLYMSYSYYHHFYYTIYCPLKFFARVGREGNLGIFRFYILGRGRTWLLLMFIKCKY